MNLILESAKHCAHPLVLDGTLSFMPSFRLMPWPDGNQPAPWGLTQTDAVAAAHAVLGVWSRLPAEKRYLDIVGGLARCCNRAFPGAPNEWKPTQADILIGLFSGCFCCDQDIALLSPFARIIRASGMKPAGVWIDAENYPDPADPAYADITPVWTRATGRPAGELPEVARAALHTSAVLICEALGWHDGDVITAAANGPGMVSDHWWEPDQIPQGTAGSLFTHIDPAQSPPEFARRLSVAQAKGCTSVFIYADDVSADQLASHGDALRGLGAS